MISNLPRISRYRKLLGLFAVLFMLTGTVLAQNNITVTGKVTDIATNEPLVGVTVKAKLGKLGAITDAKGEFSMAVVPNDVLTFTTIGYTSLDIPVNGKININAQLTAEAKGLNEVVVIGYGSRKKADITSAISSISSKDIERSTALTPELALQGQATGVQVTSAGGDPTARPTVRIRGISSFNNADPLYVIDGVPLAEGGAGATVDKVNDPTLRGPVNIYTIINPNDIESISVLKDASAAAIYGVRAANGVILITTKKGKKGQMRIDFDGQIGTSRIIKNYQVLNTQQYTKYYTDMYNAYPQLDGTTPVPIGQSDYFGAFFDPASPKYIGNLPTYDWQTAIENKHAMITDDNLRLSGGTDNTQYSVSGGYSRNDSPIKGVSATRYSVSSNVNSKLNKYIEAGLNLRLIQEHSTIGSVFANAGGGDNDLSVYKAAPFQPIYDPNGPNGYASLYTVNSTITPSSFDVTKKYGLQFTSIGNYLGALSMNTNTHDNQSVIGTAYVQVQPITGLKIKGSYSGSQFQVTQAYYSAFDSWQFGETPNNPYASFVSPPVGSSPNGMGRLIGTTTNIDKSLNANYTHSFGKHNIDVLVDASQQNYKWLSQSSSGSVYTSDPTLRYFNTNADSKSYYSLNGAYALIGYLARVSYNYASKYYLDGVVRRDGSSRFAPGHQWGTFPSGSAAYRISQEDFMKGLTWLNDLKLRGGYGVLGNEQTTGGWAYLSVAGKTLPSYNLGDVNKNNPGIAYVSFPNVDLTWEKKHSANVGFDAELFNNSVNFTFDYYHNVTHGIIQSVALTPSSGIQQSTDQNIATVLNRGFEFSIAYNKTFGKVGFNATANLTTLHNEVLALHGGTALRGAGLEVGQPVGFIYGYKVGGIFQNQAEIDAYNQNLPSGYTKRDQLSNQQKPGDMYFQDLHGAPKAGSTAYTAPDGVVNSDDQTNIGNTVPKFYYGFTLGATYAGFDVNAFFQGVGSVQKYDNALAQGTTSGYGRNQFVDVLNAWTPDHPSTTMPRAVYGDPNGNNRFSSRFVESAAYLRFQNLTIGYTIPGQLLAKTNVISRFRIFMTGTILFTITKYKGIDPENDFFPTPRQIIAGVKASF